MEKRYLVLADGSVYEGQALGARASSVGELVFTTGMCGYIETLTDPSYYGQIVMQTFPLIGNYGIIPEDFEGECRVKGYVVRQSCDAPSNFRCAETLDAFLKRAGVPGICGVDTREITRRLRARGVMNAALCDAPDIDLNKLKEYAVKNAVEAVTTPRAQRFEPQGQARFHVALIDYGAKRNIVRELLRRGCRVTALPAGARAAEVLALRPDGLMLSNGPGDPADNVGCIAELRELLGRLPIFGICLGHQLLALAAGARTEKLPYGHRGANQPVKETGGSRTYITSQNHGYAVVSDSLKTGRVSYVNANDFSCEGVDYPDQRAFTVQFHPEACAGPRDTGFLFDRFLELMEVK